MTHAEYFPIRGLIEGFYGKPWSHQQRMEMMAFIQRHHFNAYFYAPKDDPYIRDHWEQNYPEKELHLLRELSNQARKHNLAFYYCLSPGLSLCYSNERHRERLMAKYRTLFDLGVRHFGLLFDDIPQELLHEADKNNYQSLAEAHVQLTRHVYRQLVQWSGDIKLVVCPAQYHGLGDEPYITCLGRNLPTDIQLFWTGRFVCSPTLTEQDAIQFIYHTGHRPLYWDNYPVNDLLMADELHLGPLLHRDRQLYRYASGFVANAMELAESSKIPLITIGDYLTDPEKYQPERSWERAIEEVVGPADTAAFRCFADNVRSSFLNDQESPRLMALLQRVRFDYQFDNPEQAVQQLQEEFAQMEEAAEWLRTRMSNQQLLLEITPWLDKFWHWSKVGQAAAALMQEGRQGKTSRALWQLIRLKRWYRAANRIPKQVCGHVMNMFVQVLLQEVEKQGR